MIALLIVGGLAAAFGFGGAADHFETAMDAWHKAVKRSVDDRDCRDQALAIIASARTLIETEEKALRTEYRAFQKADERYETAEAEYELAAERTADAWHDLDKKLAEKRAEVRRLLTDEEWAEVSARINKMSDKMEKRLRKKIKQKD